MNVFANPFNVVSGVVDDRWLFFKEKKTLTKRWSNL